MIHLQLGDRRALIADNATAQLFQLLRRLAPSDLPVLVVGETGAGKENAAHALHAWSTPCEATVHRFQLRGDSRSRSPRASCSVTRRARSPARRTTKIGLLEAADGGTVFLDEIGELPPSIQAKLLRALEAKRIMRVGSTTEITIDVRFVAATHKDLEREVRDRSLPARPLLPAAAARRSRCRRCAAGRASSCSSRAEFVADSRARGKVSTAHVFGGGDGRARALSSGPATCASSRTRWSTWPRPSKDDVIHPWHLSERVTGVSATEPRRTCTRARHARVADELRDLERRRMTEALEASNGVQKKAAELIGMPLRTFRMKSKQYGLDRR